MSAQREFGFESCELPVSYQLTVFKHVALMPDAHLGKGSMVGSVVATKDAVIPATVGVDIGCGMMAVKTPFKSVILEGKLKELRSKIEEASSLCERLRRIANCGLRIADFKFQIKKFRKESE